MNDNFRLVATITSPVFPVIVLAIRADETAPFPASEILKRAIAAVVAIDCFASTGRQTGTGSGVLVARTARYRRACW